MGLFGKKEVCCMCGGKLPMFASVSLADGKICPDCRAQGTQYITLPERFTKADMQQNFADAAENEKLYNIFYPKDYPNGLEVDYQNKLFAVASQKALKQHTAYIFRFDELVDYSVNQDGQTIQKSGAGSALVGGILFGGVGLVAGGLMGRKAKETITHMDVTLKLNNRWASEVKINILSAEVKKGSAAYNLIKASTEQLLQVLDTIAQH